MILVEVNDLRVHIQSSVEYYIATMIQNLSLCMLFYSKANALLSNEKKVTQFVKFATTYSS